MELRAYQPADLEEIYQLFYDTVHSVNRKDYGLEQLDAWAPRQMDRPRWEQSLADHETWVAWEDGKIVGFGDLGEGGLSGSAVCPQGLCSQRDCFHFAGPAGGIRCGPGLPPHLYGGVYHCPAVFRALGLPGSKAAGKAAARSGVYQFRHGKNTASMML